MVDFQPRMSFQKRTRLCGELRSEDVGQTVTLNGWCHRILELGGLFFLDLRHRSCLFQLYFDVKKFPTLRELRSEFVLTATGNVRKRTPKSINANLPTERAHV